MKLTRSQGAWQIRFGRQEWRFVRPLFGLFPLVPPDYHQAVRQPATPEVADVQSLLDEAVSAHAGVSKDRLARLIAEGERRAGGDGAWLRIAEDETEWFLQVLNDLRIGSWICLGCPDEKEGRPPQKIEGQARYLLAMECAGLIQSWFLRGSRER